MCGTHVKHWSGFITQLFIVVSVHIKHNHHAMHRFKFAD
ncbi:Uncharacterised protein [Vibrio cholerae]|nr:Uncharacterised protein [Vibrio cholerae]CSI43532.1 Uncharacterised protein [Vibrio cholerae]